MHATQLIPRCGADLRCRACLRRGALALLMVLSQTVMGATVAKDKNAAAATPDPLYTVRNDHDPDGIGKYYFGREIAAVMTFHGAPWLEREEREVEERLTLLVEALKLKPGMVVADIGAGSGVISVLMAKQVGATGKVIAVDIQQEMLDLLGAKLNRLDVRNVELVLGTEQDPRFEPDSVDLAIMVDVYHEFEYPYEMTAALARGLKPGGRIAFVEYRREDPQVPIKLVHKMTQRQVRKEIERPELRLKWVETVSKLPRQHVILFEKLAPSETEDGAPPVETGTPAADE